ncbi:hypothetical protein D8B26_007601 [Coccidioides posadasii str. Silveira]|uniref:uncharacterized protein n=1 Tax=Coccidioides posadasii (strain RMSCC 757 / Silveira) TaxID=443226 RepID=UPI001BEEB424|nr:hypothetical protein D8B26_007601 [Coccidioides posadasii str. Silveira]
MPLICQAIAILQLHGCYQLMLPTDVIYAFYSNCRYDILGLIRFKRFLFGLIKEDALADLRQWDFVIAELGNGSIGFSECGCDLSTFPSCNLQIDILCMTTMKGH